MLLEGHEGHVHGCEFSHDGQRLASGSFDKTILLWQVYHDVHSYARLHGHKNAVTDVHWASDDERIFSASSDKTAAVWDADSGQMLRQFKNHVGCVNAVAPAYRGGQTFASASDDCTAQLWDVRTRANIETLDCEFPVLSVAYSLDNLTLYTAGIDPSIKVWDLRKNAVVMTLDGHAEAVTGLSLSPDGDFLLSNSMDNTLRSWDVRPFAPAQRCTKVYTGHAHSFEQYLLRCNWSADGKRVSAGSADRLVYVWDADSTKMLYKLPGHAGSVNQVAFHPLEPIIASCSHDKNIYLGEIAPSVSSSAAPSSA